MASKTIIGGTNLDGKCKSTSNGFACDPALLTAIDDPKHPLYDPRVMFAVDPNHVALIKSSGVPLPLVVTNRDGIVTVIDGRQRRAAAIIANRELVAEGKDPVLVTMRFVKGTDDYLRGLIWSCNTATPNDTATWIHMYEIAIAHEHTLEEFATKNGKSISWGRSIDACLKLENSILKRVQREEIPLTVAAELAKMPHAEQLASLESMVAAGPVTAAETRRVTRERKTGVAGPRYVKPRVLRETTELVSRFVGGDLGRKRLPDGLTRDELKRATDFLKWHAGEADTLFSAQLALIKELAKRHDGNESTEEE